MCSLNKEQVKIITQDVKQAQITLSHLADDLIDHICCEVEILIEKGNTFNEAYEIMKKETGISILKKIQDDTKYLIDKNYRLMKTTMKISGNISLAMIMFGTVFKIMHWPGAGIMLSLGFLIVCVIFFPLAIYINYKNTSKRKNLFLHISLLISGIVYMVGVVFKIMHWPGAGPILLFGYLSLIFGFLPILLINKIRNAENSKDKRIYLVGFIALLIFICSNMFKMFHWPGVSVLMLIGGILLISVFLPLFTWRWIKLEGKITGQFIYGIILSMFLVLFFSLLSLNVSNNYLSGMVEHSNNELTITNYLEKRNADILDKIELNEDYPDNKSKAEHIKKQSDDLCEFIINIQVMMIEKVEIDSEYTPIELLSMPEKINDKSNMNIVISQLLDHNIKANASDLREKLGQYKEDLNMIFSYNPELIEWFNIYLDLSDYSDFKEDQSWENYNFGNKTLISAIAKLNEFQTTIRMIEKISLENINNHNNI